VSAATAPMRTLYPELTDEEYVQTITPLRRRSVDSRPATGIGDGAGEVRG